MKKYYIKLAMILFLISTWIIPICAAQRHFINVYNWGEYISNGADGLINVNEEFTKSTGIEVNYNTFQNNEELFAKLNGGGTDCDVVIPSDYMISRLIKNNMLSKINFDNVPNAKFINKRFKNLNFDPSSEYSVPYMWGVVGIFYNSKYVSESENEINWDILWNDKYKNRILMFDNARDAFAISLLRLGYSVNNNNHSHWRKAADELIKQKNIVQAYVMDQIFDKIANEEAVLAPYYAGDAAMMLKNSQDIKFCIPKNGTNRFVDAMCIPKNSKNKENAEKYIDFMCRPDVALANVKHTGYSTPHDGAYELLDENIKKSKIFYPDEDVLNNSQIFVNLSDETNKYMDELWVEVKSGGVSGSAWQIVVILFVFAIIYMIIFLYKKFKNKKIN